MAAEEEASAGEAAVSAGEAEASAAEAEASAAGAGELDPAPLDAWTSALVMLPEMGSMRWILFCLLRD